MTRLFHALVALALTPGLQMNNAGDEFSPRSMLQPRNTGLITIPANTDARSSYEALAERAGLNVAFYSGFKPESPVVKAVEGVDVFEALDLLSAQTGNFWFAWNSKTVLVVPDTPASRRDIEPQVLKTVYANAAATNVSLLGGVNALRTVLGMRGVFLNESARAIVVRDSPAKVAMAEKLIADRTNGGQPLSTSAAMALSENGTANLFIAESGKTRRVVPSTQSHLDNKGTVSIDMTDTPRAVYENLAFRAGMNVVFHGTFRDLPASRFRLDNVSLLDALDLLALQTRTLWQPLNESTLFVMDDSQQNRRSYDIFAVKVIYFSRGATVAEINGIMNTLRVVLSLRGVFASDKAKAIVIRDTPLRVLMAEKLIADLDRKGLRPPSVTIAPPTSSFLAENGWTLGAAITARPLLDLELRSRTTIRLNEMPRAAFQKLAELAGVDVTFDSRVQTGAPSPLNLNNVDILDALDLLSFQSGHFWQVVDRHTIRVIPDSQAIRRELEPLEEKTLYPADSTPEGAAGMVNVLRTALELRQVQVNDKNLIIIRDTADNIALAEKVLEALGRPAL